MQSRPLNLSNALSYLYISLSCFPVFPVLFWSHRLVLFYISFYISFFISQISPQCDSLPALKCFHPCFIVCLFLNVFRSQCFSLVLCHFICFNTLILCLCFCLACVACVIHVCCLGSVF